MTKCDRGEGLKLVKDSMAYATLWTDPKFSQ